MFKQVCNSQYILFKHVRQQVFKKIIILSHISSSLPRGPSTNHAFQGYSCRQFKVSQKETAAADVSNGVDAKVGKPTTLSTYQQQHKNHTVYNTKW